MVMVMVMVLVMVMETSTKICDDCYDYDVHDEYDDDQCDFEVDGSKIAMMLVGVMFIVAML